MKIKFINTLKYNLSIKLNNEKTYKKSYQHIHNYIILLLSTISTHNSVNTYNLITLNY